MSYIPALSKEVPFQSLTLIRKQKKPEASSHTENAEFKITLKDEMGTSLAVPAVKTFLQGGPSL